MRLPNADDAIIDRPKLEGYLLSEAHPVGRFKARFFATLGFTADKGRELEAALRSQHVPESVTPGPAERVASPSRSGLCSRGRAMRLRDSSRRTREARHDISES